MKSFSIIVIADKNNGIGKNGDMPWHLPADLKHFARVTTSVKSRGKVNAVIMGRKTWESIPETHRPLKNRLNVVLTHADNVRFSDSIAQFSSLENALITLCKNSKIENIFVIGGGKVFAAAINHPFCQKIYLTQINHIFDCDVFFPKINPEQFKITDKSPILVDGGIEMNFMIYERV